MYFVVVIMVLIIAGVMWFFYANAIQQVETAVNPNLGSDKFASPNNWNSFNLANTFINNLWAFLLVFVLLGLAYYGYIEAQRRQ